MPNVIEAGAKWLEQQQLAYASYPATYFRGGDYVRLCAVQARSTRTLSDEQGGTRVVELEDDWLVAVCDLRLSAGLAEPLLGDTIVIQSGPKAGTYELLQPSPTTRHAERINAGTMWRLHTKRLKGPSP